MSKFLLNGLQIAPDGAGISRYTYELAKYYKQSHTNIDILVRRDVSSKFDNNSNLIIYNKNIKNSKDRIIAEQVKTLKIFNQYDLIHCPDYAVPVLTTTSCVATIHDLAFFAIDDKYTNLQVLTKKFLMNITVRKAKKLICISKFTAQELIKYYPKIDDSKIEIIYNGFKYDPSKLSNDRINLSVRFKIYKPYILYVGTLSPSKNIKRLVQAFYVLKKLGYDYQLVVAGKKGWMYGEIFNEVKKMNLENEIIFTGYVSEEELESLYKNCKFFSFISLYEGFGFPPLEAMARKKPVLVSKVASIPEVVGDAGLYCNPYSVEDIAKNMVKLIKDDNLTNMLINKGCKRVKDYSWDITAKKTYEVYEKILLDKK
jgi:glycosyltransferase involved in cell wall biosynthesis